MKNSPKPKVTRRSCEGRNLLDETLNNLITDNLNIWTTAIKSKSRTGRGTNKTYELYGIKKLRALILDLAVRGLLVPQDPNDEPASELLKKIAEEKEQLLKEGKIKKQKTPPEISEEEKPFDIPSNWEWKRFPNLCYYNTGKTPSTKNPTYWDNNDEGYPWISISDMTHYQNVYETKKHISEEARSLIFKVKPVKSGTLIMSFKLTVGKVSKLAVDAYHNEAIISIYPFNGVDQSYLYRFLPNRAKVGNTKKAIKGNTLNSKSLAMISIPLPPLAEQKRIVAKVDELMALCDQLEQQTDTSIKAHKLLVENLLSALTQAKDHKTFHKAWQRIAQHFDSLFTTEHSIDQLKQTILQLAVMGKLVPQNPNDEPASELLKKIAKEKEKLIKQGKIKKQKPLPEISEEEKPFELPDGWECVSFGKVANFLNGDRGKNYPNKSEYTQEGVPWINTGHIKPDGTLSKSKMHYISKQKFDTLRGGKVEKGDLVYCLRGATFGKTSFIKPFKNGAIASSLMIIRPYICDINEYIYKYLMSPFGKSQVFRFDNGSAQPNLSAKSVTLYSFPLPPLNEQKRIVKKVNQLLKLCDTLKQNLKTQQTTTNHLADTIACIIK